MKKLFTLVFSIYSLVLFAQPHPSCTELRYSNDVFDEIIITKNLKFGEGTTFGGNNQELFLDIYEPMGDTTTMRPAIVLAFGGSFIGGERENMADLCEFYAKKGFVAVTIDYRLYDGPFVPLPNGEQMSDVVVKTISDMKAAIRYLREDAATTNLYKIDPDFIFSGGISAGAIVAAHVATIDSTDNISPELEILIENNGGFEGNSSTNLQYSSDVKGFINYSGALIDATLMDVNDPPFYSAHDDQDPVVPFGAGNATIFSVPIIAMEGSGVMHARADTLGIQNELHTIENSNNHVSYFQNSAQFEIIANESAAFLRSIICKDFVSNVTEAVPSKALASVQVFPNPTQGFLQLTNKNNLDLSVKLYDLTGRLLEIWQNPDQISLSTYANGYYTLLIEDKSSRERVIRPVILQQ